MSVRKFQDGETAIVNDKLSTYDIRYNGVNSGTIVKIIKFMGYDGMYNVEKPDGSRITMNTKALDKTKAKTSIEKFQEQIEKAKENIVKTETFIAETLAKISFLQEIGSDIFDENEFKAFHTLTIIEQGNMSKIEKAKAIAALISKK